MDIREVIIKQAGELGSKKISKVSDDVAKYCEDVCKDASAKWVYCTENKLKKDKPVLDKVMKACVFIDHINKGLGRFNRHCAGCYNNAFKRLNKIYNPDKPKLVKDTMVEHDVSKFHEGAGWYKFPNGEKVRGKENAEQYLKSKG